MNVAVRDHGYEYGALWSIVDDPDGLARRRAVPVPARHPRTTSACCRPGWGRVSVFWSERGCGMAGVLARGLPAWRAAGPAAGRRVAPLLDRVDQLLPAAYRDVVVRTPYRLAGPGARAVLVGDAAHAMSPQLGTGTSLALADAWTLHHALATEPTSRVRWRRTRRPGARHVRWYQWWTRLMMPVFQSSLTPLGVAARPGRALRHEGAGDDRQAVTTLLGDRTSPWSAWRLPELP